MLEIRCPQHSTNKTGLRASFTFLPPNRTEQTTNYFLMIYHLLTISNQKHSSFILPDFDRLFRKRVCLSLHMSLEQRHLRPHQNDILINWTPESRCGDVGESIGSLLKWFGNKNLSKIYRWGGLGKIGWRKGLGWIPVEKVVGVPAEFVESPMDRFIELAFSHYEKQDSHIPNGPNF